MKNLLKNPVNPYIMIIMVLAIVQAMAQEPIKFQIPTDENGMPIMVAPPPKDTAQKLGLASNLPLNLAALSAKDTAGFESYSKRYALIQDSILATQKIIEAVKKNTASFMPKLEPKGEFEKQAEYDARKSKWDGELAQRIERDAKSLTQRLAELEKAKKKVQENQASLYGSIEIKSSPSAVSIWLGGEEIGTTPAEYNLLIPGEAKIRLQKEGYSEWDTTLQVKPGAKLKLSAILEEKSIFSQENEIRFAKILSKDTTVQGYLARTERIKARKAEIDEEIKQILENFSNTYPPLEPQKSGESPEAFEKRKKAWTEEGMKQFTGLQKKHKAYSDKLLRSVEVLQDNIVALQSSIASETVISAKIELGAYDAEREIFKVTAQDTASEKSPFYFSGEVGVPLNTAKNLNRSSPGFASALRYINYPFETDLAKVNLAMLKLQFSLNGQELKTGGSFAEIERYKAMEGYSAWKARADSLLSGALKPQGFDYAYAAGKDAGKDAKDKAEGEGLTGKGIFRIAMFGLSAASLGLALWQNGDVDEKSKKRNAAYMEAYNAQHTPEYEEKSAAYNESEKEFKASKNLRAGFYIGAGVFGAAGIASFFF